MRKWIGAMATSAAMLLLSRWMMQIGRPLDDWYLFTRLIERVKTWLRDGWTILWRAYGPITKSVKSQWELLRRQYQAGKYGTQGT